MKNKTTLNKLKKSFFKCPNKIHDIGLSAIAIALYSYLAKCPEDFNPSVGVLARQLKISKPTVIKYLQELKDRNIIQVIRPGGQNTITLYEFNETKDWK